MPRNKLATFADEREPGRVYSPAEIAQACGCSDRAIRDIEQKALAKLRWELRRERVSKEELPESL